MFDFSFLEIAVVCVLGLIVLGPRKLPGFVRWTAGKFFWLKRQVEQLRKDVGIDDLLEIKEDIGEGIRHVKSQIIEESLETELGKLDPLDYEARNKLVLEYEASPPGGLFTSFNPAGIEVKIERIPPVIEIVQLKPPYRDRSKFYFNKQSLNLSSARREQREQREECSVRGRAL